MSAGKTVRYRSLSPTVFAHRTRSTSALGLLLLATACSGGGGRGEDVIAGGFVAVRSDPSNGNRIYLNDPINIDFSAGVDLDSASLETVSFLALDQNGEPTSEQVNGTFVLSTSPGDDRVGRRLQFVPRLATDEAFSNGGLRGGRTYLVRLVDGESRNGTVLRGTDGRGLERPTSFSFTTYDGTQPADLFRNPHAGGPALRRLEIGDGIDPAAVPLNLFGLRPLEVRLVFDQALNPSPRNVPIALDTDPVVRDPNDRGRVFLEYDDPALGGAPTWIPADVTLEENGLAGAVVTLRPVGVLPNHATIRVIVESTLEDIAGESNVGNVAYDRVVATFATTASYEQQWNGIAEDFADARSIDFGAVFPEAQAIVERGFVRAGFAFEGTPTSLDYEPTSTEVVLNTDFTQVVPKVGLPFTVSGGVFNFRNVSILPGVTVTGQGTKPMVWLCSGDFRVAGTLSVSGGNGARVTTLQSANFPKAGGLGHCGAGNGGSGSLSAIARDLTGEPGYGAFQEPGKGGGGGRICCNGACYTPATTYHGDGGGSGGGGGTLATQGDPNWRGTLGTGGTSFQQVFGIGGAGCSGLSGTRTATLLGGAAGPKVCTDPRADNDFWGSAINLFTNTRITGELAKPLGGGGGGGGGDLVIGGSCDTPSWITDSSGGGGGGGGGVLIVKALGEIEVLPTGKIVADGGHGGGGEQAGSCEQGGGGGGGSGGMVVLMSAKRIVLHQHGSPQQNRWNYAQNDYDFAVSADGGVTLTGDFGTTRVYSKYPTNGQAMLAGTTYDEEPLGGLGGMGIVQLMVPPGPNLQDYENGDDGTNTKLDDFIVVKRRGTSGEPFVLSPATAPGEKQKALAWRGFLDAATPPKLVDDNGTPIVIGNNEGDIRPSPILLPVPFSAKSRVRSKWIDTGSSQRRQIAAADGQPRGVVAGDDGPIFEFAGIDTPTSVATPGYHALPGYVAYRPLSGAVEIAFPTPVVGAVPIASVFADGLDYRVTLAEPALGEPNRYAQYQAELLNDANAVLGGFRILSHTSQSLLVAADGDGLPAGATKLQIRAKFFEIVTNGAPGLGPTYTYAGTTVPNANVRIGFAFHRDPSSSVPTDRFPADAQEFVHDVDGLFAPGSAFLAWVGAGPKPRYVQWTSPST